MPKKLWDSDVLDQRGHVFFIRTALSFACQPASTARLRLAISEWHRMLTSGHLLPAAAFALAERAQQSADCGAASPNSPMRARNCKKYGKHTAQLLGDLGTHFVEVAWIVYGSRAKRATS
jgi:hypothetical protein